MTCPVDEIIEAMLDRDPAYLPDYVDPMLPLIEVRKDFDFSTIEEGRICFVNCRQPQQSTFANNVVIRNLAIISGCRLSGNDGIFENVVLASLSDKKDDGTGTS